MAMTTRSSISVNPRIFMLVRFRASRRERTATLRTGYQPCSHHTLSPLPQAPHYPQPHAHASRAKRSRDGREAGEEGRAGSRDIRPLAAPSLKRLVLERAGIAEGERPRGPSLRSG